MYDYDNFLISKSLNLLIDNLKGDFKLYFSENGQGYYSLYIEREYNFRYYESFSAITLAKNCNDKFMSYESIKEEDFNIIKNIIDVLKIEIEYISKDAANKKLHKSEIILEKLNNYYELLIDKQKTFENQLNEVTIDKGIELNQDILDIKDKINDLEVNYLYFNQ